MRERITEGLAVIIILSALVVREAWMLIPESDTLYRPFPFYDIEIGAQTYFAFVCHYLFILFMALAFSMIMTEYREFLILWFFLQAAELGDYFLTYNTAWFTFLGIGIGITIVKLASLSIVAIYKLWKT